ncbi:hypothetical protein AAMO2058_001427300 [Amorphochlora amoebiformis]
MSVSDGGATPSEREESGGGLKVDRHRSVGTISKVSGTKRRATPTIIEEDGKNSSYMPSKKIKKNPASSQRGSSERGSPSKRLKKPVLKRNFEEKYKLEGKVVPDQCVSNPFQVQVRTALHKATGDQRVVKILNKETLDMTKIRREIQVMMGLRHENVVRFYEAFEDKYHVYICMEYVKGGELFDQLAGIAHCDIKPENVLFTSDKPDSSIKIIDFGMSQRVARGKIRWLTDQVGTYAYRAPEQLDKKYTRACDMWAVGVTMFMLLTGFGPFHTASNSDTIRRIREGFHAEIKEGYGNWLNPKEALAHPWLAEASESKEQLLGMRVITQLQSASAMTRFHRAVCNALAQWVPKGELYLLEKAFKESDTNGDGLMSIDEFRTTVRRFNQSMSEKDVQRVFNECDINGDRYIDYNELLLACVHHRLVSSEERLWRVFSELDTNNDNYISSKELAQVLGNRREAEELIKQIDSNKDGRISYSEFLNMWKGYS